MPPPITRQLVRLGSDLRLEPVVEFSPVFYARQEHLSPEGSLKEMALEWQHYWELCLADSGLHLQPLFPGSWLVPLSRLTDPHVLRELLRVPLQYVDAAEAQTEPLLERVTALTGGHALLDGEHVVLTPRCCCDLGYLVSWENAARLKCNGFWMGHPQVFASWEEPWLALCEDEPYWEGVCREWHLSPLVLGRAARAARKEQEDFARRLVPLLSDRFPPGEARSLAFHLAGLDGLEDPGVS
ncbi:hypothetical protein [Vitiosangium sp. GDMCC 1.1324]|uniref:hypothetical protein n=1 Tax=Vitiosangium sp. (strain GDMCC 1.1324) TaxID=2138576 RepID=UPI000D3BD8C8|nr:hypothetical protein [Vitiosangium sp. GDMCC 1.1324]PTL83299.1 hypothetical protein DAT35_15025 [Vitiosangium sp. GDMCC 1.1324]